MGRIEELQREFEADLSGIANLDAWKNVRDKWLSRENGIVTAEMKRLRELPKEQRPEFGQAMNRLRGHVEQFLEESRTRIQGADLSSRKARIDVTRPGFPFALGREHPIKRLQAEIEQVREATSLPCH